MNNSNNIEIRLGFFSKQYVRDIFGHSVRSLNYFSVLERLTSLYQTLYLRKFICHLVFTVLFTFFSFSFPVFARVVPVLFVTV